MKHMLNLGLVYKARFDRCLLVADRHLCLCNWHHIVYKINNLFQYYSDNNRLNRMNMPNNDKDKITNELLWEDEEMSGSFSPTNFLINENQGFYFSDLNT